MKYVNGDLIELAKDGKYDVIIHGCNCFNTMGAGVAKGIAKEFPEAYQADRETISGDDTKLGTITYATIYTKANKKLVVINAYTQYNFGREDGVTYVKYHAIMKAFKKVKESFGNQGLRFGIPKIGSGLAGGNWVIIEHIIKNSMINEDVEVVVKEN